MKKCNFYPPFMPFIPPWENDVPDSLMELIIDSTEEELKENQGCTRYGEINEEKFNKFKKQFYMKKQQKETDEQKKFQDEILQAIEKTLTITRTPAQVPVYSEKAKQLANLLKNDKKMRDAMEVILGEKIPDLSEPSDKPEEGTIFIVYGNRKSRMAESGRFNYSRKGFLSSDDGSCCGSNNDLVHYQLVGEYSGGDLGNGRITSDTKWRYMKSNEVELVKELAGIGVEPEPEQLKSFDVNSD